MTIWALDTNVAILFIVGIVDPSFIHKHRRLGGYSSQDYELLLQMLGHQPQVIATPYCLAELSNLVPDHVREPLRSSLMEALAEFIVICEENVQKSAQLALDYDFFRLGLTDVAWLHVLKPSITLVTLDVQLYAEALQRGFDAINFTHVREAAGVFDAI